MDSTKVHADLRILATSDVHMHITGWDALRDTIQPGQGMDVLARSIMAARRAAPGQTILVDNGDALQGTPLGNICAGASENTPHPWPGILNALSYDAVGLGNHDFDFGLPFLERVLAQIDAPVLCASLSRGTIAGVGATTIIKRLVACSDGGERMVSIGITSVLPPQTAIWNHRHLDGRVAFDDGVQAARRAVTALRRNGADIVVVLCHSGLSPVTAAGAENFAATLAAKVRGIDAMIMGHTHELFPGKLRYDSPKTNAEKGTVHGVPAVMPGFAAQALGVIDLGLRWSEGRWRVAGHVAVLHGPWSRQAPDPTVTAIAAPAIKATRAALDAPLARSETGFHSYFEMLKSGPSSALLARAMRHAIGAHVAGTDLADLPLIAAIAPMALGGVAGPGHYAHVPAGVVRERHVAMLTPYSNAIWAVVLRGQDLWNWAERSAAYFDPQPHRDRPLVNPAAPAYNFDGLHGLHTVIDPFVPPRFDATGMLIDPAARRVRAMFFDGNPVAPEDAFLVAMTSYRGAGGGGFPGLATSPTVLRTEIELSAALRTEIAAAPLPDTPEPSVWQFVPDLGAQVVIETSPNALSHLDEIADFAPEPLGINDAGFAELRVTL
ncbi:5'-nucleotidase C-terminal domain-containing protein [Tateyamaria sp. SN3-11]|uniref:5'-nucleotidase C-terminal domain-containing protein n=1 Tax=Tateyamaria sp. SN3-11 TaxID=3092147 RepID=UPI0039EBE2CD